MNYDNVLKQLVPRTNFKLIKKPGSVNANFSVIVLVTS